MPENEFAGRVALVTGAGSGIGAACARWLAQRGARLVLVDRDGDALAALGLGPEVANHVGDVADEALWERVEQATATLDFAVLNAGRADARPIVDLTLEGWRSLMAVNLDGAMLGLRTALRAMLPAKAGAVVLTASAAGIKAEPGTAAYGASKAAVIQLMRVAAKEAAPAGVRVNAIAPGGVDTPIWDQVPMFDQLVREHGSRAAAIAAMGAMATPLGRFATADEIAAQIGFLLSDAAATITGAVLTSDCGYTL